MSTTAKLEDLNRQQFKLLFTRNYTPWRYGRYSQFHGIQSMSVGYSSVCCLLASPCITHILLIPPWIPKKKKKLSANLGYDVFFVLNPGYSWFGWYLHGKRMKYNQWALTKGILHGDTLNNGGILWYNEETLLGGSSHGSFRWVSSPHYFTGIFVG